MFYEVDAECNVTDVVVLSGALSYNFSGNAFSTLNMSVLLYVYSVSLNRSISSPTCFLFRW